MNTDKTCNSSCEQLHNEVLKMKAWIATENSTWTSFEMLAQIENLNPNQYRSHLYQFQQICHLVDGFASDIQNIFDNYVCFHGKEDKIQLANFIQSSHSRVLVNFSSVEFANCMILKEFIVESCNKLEQICISENDKIIEYEVKLGNALKTRLLQEVQCNLQQFVTLKPLNEHQNIVSNIEKCVLTIISRCLDNNGKLNHVQTEITEKLLEEFTLNLQTFKGKESYNNESSLIEKATHYYYSKSLEKELYKDPIKFSEEEIRDHHNLHLDKACSFLELEEDKYDLKKLLECHLIYMYFRRNEQKQSESFIKQTSTSQNQPSTLFVYLTPNESRLDSFDDSHTILPIVFPPYIDPWFPAVLALKDDDEIVFGSNAKFKIDKKQAKNIRHSGLIDGYIRESDPNGDTDKTLIKLFKQFKITAQTSLQKYCSRVIFLVPSWYNEYEHQKIFRMSTEANFTTTKVLDESCVIAYKMLEEARKDKNDRQALAVLISISPDNALSVKIFASRKEVVYTCVLIGASFFNRNKLLETKDIKRIYNKALLQIDPCRRDANKYCCVLDASKSSQGTLEEFLASEDFTCMTGDCRYQYGVRGAALLTLSPLKPSETIFNFLHADDEETVTQPSSTFRDDKDSFPGEKNEPKENLEKCRALESKRKQLLQKCRNFKRQIAEGEVKVGRLFVKDVLEVLDKAEQVASNEYASSTEIEFEECEIAELVLEYLMIVQANMCDVGMFLLEYEIFIEIMI